jgi:hypothetical protein
MKRPRVASPPWTSEEEDQLRTGIIAGEHPADIAKKLSRSEGAVRHRMIKLGLQSKSVKRRLAVSTPSTRMQALRDFVSAGAKMNSKET